MALRTAPAPADPAAREDAVGVAPEERPAPAPVEAPLTEADLLVEDVSIDGMCGVY